MPPKKIFVKDTSGNDCKKLLGSQQGYERMLSSLGVECLKDADGFEVDDLELLISDNVYTLGDTIARQQLEPVDFQQRFRRLAQEAAMNVREPAMNLLLMRFAPSVQAVNTPAQAAMLHARAAKMPRSVTEVLLRQRSIFVGEVVNATETSKAILPEAFEDGAPCLLKIENRQKSQISGEPPCSFKIG